MGNIVGTPSVMTSSVVVACAVVDDADVVTMVDVGSYVGSHVVASDTGAADMSDDDDDDGDATDDDDGDATELAVSGVSALTSAVTSTLASTSSTSSMIAALVGAAVGSV